MHPDDPVSVKFGEKEHRAAIWCLDAATHHRRIPLGTAEALHGHGQGMAKAPHRTRRENKKHVCPQHPLDPVARGLPWTRLYLGVSQPGIKKRPDPAAQPA